MNQRLFVIFLLFGSLILFLIHGSQDIFIKNHWIFFIAFLIIQCLLLKIFFETNEKEYTPFELGIIHNKMNVIIPLSFAVIFFLIHVFMIWMKNVQLTNLIEDQQSFAYFSLALRITDPITYIPEWLREMQIPLLYWGGHLATHLPGYPLIIHAAFQVLGQNSSSVMYLVSIISALTIFPIFWMSNLIYGWRVAVISCVLYSWVPALILNFPYMDLILGFFVCFSILFFLYSFRNENFIMSLVGGLFLSLSIFMSYVSASILIMVLIFTIFSGESKKITNLLFYFLGAVIPFMIMEMLMGWPIVQATLSAHRTNSWFYWHLHSLNPSVWNIGQSSFFFFMFIGLPLCVMFFIAVIRSFYDFYNSHEHNMFVLSFAVVLLVTILFAKLELSRVASFLIPFIVIVSSSEIMKWKNGDGLITNSILIILAQFIIFLVHISQISLYSSLLGYPIV